MSNRASIICSIWLTALGVAAAGCGATEAGSTSVTAVAASNASQSTSTDASSAKKPFNLASTLDGKTVLPHRIHWRALPALPASKVQAVEFVIDGRRAWVEHKPPYTYAEGGGCLVTSWLKPGKHHLTVRAIPIVGHPATDAVTGRVLPAPRPPSALAGTWQRKISDTSAALL